MELWFWLAVFSAIASGLGNFTNKIAVKQALDSSLVIFYSSIISTSVIAVIAIAGPGFSEFPGWLFLILFVTGLVAAMSNLFKIKGLECIDTTIFYPLFKLVGPLIAIVLGILFFAESFNSREWMGLILSLFIPLLLITKIENHRQNNLLWGIIFVLLAGLTAAIYAAVQKYAVDQFANILWIMTAAGSGIFTGGFFMFIWKNRKESLYHKLHENTSKKLLGMTVFRGTMLTASFVFSLLAMRGGGPLGIVYTINSLYILIPIVLSIFIYDEHWNTQKVIAIILSILALGLLG